jgi:NADH:ubiquinone oxidoreductase subunit F (NADH-binding)
VNGFKLNYVSDKDNCYLEIKKENPSKIAFNNNIEKNTDYKLLGKNSMDKNDFKSAIRYYLNWLIKLYPLQISPI